MSSITINGQKRSLERVKNIAWALFFAAVLFVPSLPSDPAMDFKNVTVHHGDTLENIILENSDIPWGGHIQNLIIRTKEVNKANLDTIYPGQQIRIAVYKK